MWGGLRRGKKFEKENRKEEEWKKNQRKKPFVMLALLHLGSIW